MSNANELTKASERWIKDGKEFKDSINAWLDIIYIDGKNPDTECPEETRKDMAEYVLNQLVEFNKEGKHKEFRELFPPDNDPISGDIRNDMKRWHPVYKTAMLADGRIIVKLGDCRSYSDSQSVYVIQGDDFTLIDDLIGFGFSKDKQYFAKVYNDRIDIHEGWDGPICRTFTFPDGSTANDMQYDSVEVFSDGNRIILITHYGIFFMDENNCRMIHGSLAGEEDEKDNDVPEERSANEPERPATVPAEARWNASDNEWETGKNNADGQPVGEWKWWLAPKGYLCCRTIYEGNDGEVMSFTRFHQDGTPSRIGKYVNGQPFGDIIWIRSENPTIEEYPSNAESEVWKTVSTIKSGYTVEEHYYDKEGIEIQEPYISNLEMSELIKKMGVADRLYVEKDWKHLLDAAEDLIESGDAEDEDQDQMKVVYYKAYAMFELNNRQQFEGLEDLADTILDLDTFTTWPYLSEFNINRSAIRFAHYIKAQLFIDNEEYEDAWDELKEAFDITSPIDDEDMTPYCKMKEFLASELGDLEDDDESEEGEDGKYTFLDYPHAAISPDDKYIALGSYWGPHIIMVEKDGEWTETAHIEARSSYPNIACFNYKMNKPVVALSSCHFSRSGTLGVILENIEGLEASGYDMDSDELFIIDDKKWIFSMYPSAHGYYLGDNDGYIWRKISNKKSDYIFIGGTVMSIDISPDNKYIVVGTHSGQVVVLSWDGRDQEEGKNPRVDPYLVTNLPVVDEKRYVFTKDAGPLIW